jgi:hypothetical protein
MPGKIYPNEKEKLLEMLSADELKMIKKDFPFKHLRNEKIHELIDKGVSPTVLAKLTGMGKSNVHRIGGGGGRSVRILTQRGQNQEDDLKKINNALDAFYKQIKKILKQRRNY